MPALENFKHEAMAQAILANMAKPYGERSNGRAYLEAGGKVKDVGKTGGSAEAAASRLLKNVKGILVRVAELQELERKRRKCTVQDIANELDEARELALNIEQPSAAVAATATKAKVLGLSIDRVEIGKRGDFSTDTTPNAVAQRMLMIAAGDRLPDAQAIDRMALSAALSELSRHAAAMADIVDALCARRATVANPVA